MDNVIAKLLEVRGSRPGRQVNLSEAEIRGLCTNAREIFMQQPVLLELEAPIKICGARLPSHLLTASLRLSQAAEWSVSGLLKPLLFLAFLGIGMWDVLCSYGLCRICC